MATKQVDLTRLKQSIEYMSKASANYRAKVKEQKEKREALTVEPQGNLTPRTNLNGDTVPS